MDPLRATIKRRSLRLMAADGRVGLQRRSLRGFSKRMASTLVIFTGFAQSTWASMAGVSATSAAGTTAGVVCNTLASHRRRCITAKNGPSGPHQIYVERPLAQRRNPSPSVSRAVVNAVGWEACFER